MKERKLATKHKRKKERKKERKNKRKYYKRRPNWVRCNTNCKRKMKTKKYIIKLKKEKKTPNKWIRINEWMKANVGRLCQVRKQTMNILSMADAWKLEGRLCTVLTNNENPVK